MTRQLLPYSVARSMSIECINYLHTCLTELEPDWASRLSGEDQVNYVLDHVGKGFGLSMEDIGVIEKAFAIYKVWILAQSHFNSSHYLKMFFQMSLLFEAKTVPDLKSQATAALIQRHVELMRGFFARVNDFYDKIHIK